MRESTAGAEVARIPKGSVIVTAMAAAEPYEFFRTVSSGAPISGTLYCANPTEPYEVFDKLQLEQDLEIRPLFLTSKVKQHQQRSHVHYVPGHLSQWCKNLLGNHGRVGVFWGTCSPPDDRGFVSLGPSASYEPEMIRHADRVVLEVNPRLPKTCGDTWVNLKDVDALVVVDREVPTIPSRQPSAIDERIAQRVAELIPDGATLQFGIGGIPNALAGALAERRDLGIHTEMINDAIAELVKIGAVTGRHKTIWPGRVIGAFAYGSRELYDYLDGHPMFELYPASVVNDPIRIGRNLKMISVNTAVEIDITGQVCSESIGHTELSGVGGATDTHIGAQRSNGGRGIVALASQTKNGRSKIVAELQPGAKVSISRNDIDTVVTEYGVAELRGQPVRERARRLIAAAHPDHRGALSASASKFGYL